MKKGSHHTKFSKIKISHASEGRITWSKGLTKYTDERVRKQSERLTGRKRINTWNKGKKGIQIAWNKGLTKETDKRIERMSKLLSIINKG